MNYFQTVGKAVGDYLASLALFFTNIKNAVTDGVNASNGLKEGGRIDNSSVFDIDRRLREESKPFYININQTNQTFGGSVLVKDINGGAIISPGHIFIPKHAAAGTSRQLGMFLNIGSNAPSGYSPYRIYGINSDSISAELTFKGVPEGSAVSLGVSRFSASDGDTPFSTIGSVEGDIIAKYYDKKTDYIHLMEGDSNSDYSSFASSIPDDSLYGGVIREFLCTAAIGTTKGKTARNINKAKGSTTSTMLIAAMRSGELDVTEKVNLRTTMIGTNDIVSAYNADNTLANLSTIISTHIANIGLRLDRHIKRYGTSEVWVIIAPPPIFNVAQESAMVQLRNALKTYLAGRGVGIWNGGSTPITKPVSNIYFCSGGATDAQTGLFTANSYSNYIEQSGNAIHLNVASHTLLGNYITNMFTVNSITF